LADHVDAETPLLLTITSVGKLGLHDGVALVVRASVWS